MAKRIVVPFDGSPQAEKALEYAIEEYPAADFVALYVIDPVEAGYTARTSVPSHSPEWFEEAEGKADRQLDRATEIGDAHGVSIETETAVGRPSRAIVKYAEEADVDAVVMGSHGRDGVSRILLGSVAETVVRRSPVPVTVVR